MSHFPPDTDAETGASWSKRTRSAKNEREPLKPGAQGKVKIINIIVNIILKFANLFQKKIQKNEKGNWNRRAFCAKI